MFVSLQVFVFSIYDFKTVILSWLNNKQSISIFSFLDNSLFLRSFSFLHRIYQCLFILIVDILEKDRVSYKTLNEKFSLIGLWDDFEFNNFLLVKGTKDFLWDTHSASGFALEFLSLKFRLVERNFLNVILTFRVMSLIFSVIWMKGKVTDIVGKPLESMRSGIIWSFFDDIVDHRFNPNVNICSQIILDFFFLLRHDSV